MSNMSPKTPGANNSAGVFLTINYGYLGVFESVPLTMG